MVTSYTSLLTSGRRRCASRVPLTGGQFRRAAAECPLPNNVFTPFPPRDQAVGSIVKSFAALPPIQCYRRFISKHPTNHLCHRIECFFLPNDEGHLMVCSGLYLLRPGHAALRVNSLYDGLIAQWSLGDESRRDRCSVIRGSRSSNASSCAMTRFGRFLAWPSDGGLEFFDRYAAASCHRERFFVGDCVRAVDFSPDRLSLVVISSYLRYFVLRILTNFSFDQRTPLQVISETNLAVFDDTLTVQPGTNDLVAVRHSPSGRSIAIGTKDGHFMVLSVGRFDQPILVNFGFFENSRRLTQPMRLSNYKAFDYLSQNTSSFVESNASEELAFASQFGEVILCSFTLLGRIHEVASFRLVPTSEQDCQISCLRFARVESWLAVGLSSGDMILMHSKTLRPLTKLQMESANFGPQFASNLDQIHNFTSLSFSCTDSYLAAGATDGRVRIWCLKRTVGPLSELCRRKIRSLCPKDQIKTLPLHPAILEYLNKSLVIRTDGDDSME